MDTAPHENLYLSALIGASGRRIAQALDHLLEQKVNIPQGARSRASDSQNHLRDFLCSEASRDATFPRILSAVDADFLGGSFARHTKIWPLDDIDIYFPLEGANLLYMNSGMRLPYTVQSDGPRLGNPLLLPRWTSGLYVSSAKVIQGFAQVLKRHNPRTEVRAGGQSISIRMTHGETEEFDGLGYDVVPCFSMKPDNPKEFEFYLMPDGRGGWIRTNPKLDTYVAEVLQSYHGKFYRKVVKLIKYWNTVRLDGAFSSYYIEFALSRAFWSKRTSNQQLGSVSEGLAIGFDFLTKAYIAGDQTPWIPEAPFIRRPILSATQFAALSVAQASASVAWERERCGNENDALRQWSNVFGETL